MTFGRTAPRHPGPVTRRSRRASSASVVLVSILVGQLIAITPAAAASPPPAAPPPVPPGATEPAADAGWVLPGFHYQDALAHAGDDISFEPGGRVTVGFRPRAGDAWQVDGRAPRPLPAGKMSGRELLGPPAATEPVPGGALVPGGAPAAAPSAEPSPAPVDSPSGAPSSEPEPSATPDADNASLLLPADDGDVAANATRLRKEVFGFLPYWEVNSAVLDYELLSTIAYFSVGADKNGNLLKTNSDGSTTTGWGGWTSSRLTSIINAAHSKGTRVVLTISVFAWSSGQAALQGALLGNPTARLNLAKQAAQAVRDRGADGINLDFEPIASGYADEFTALVRTFRAELNRLQAGYQLTFDTTGYIGNYPLESATAPGGADAIFIMGYDYRGAGSSSAGSISPFSGPAYDLQDTVNAYAARVPASKLILGLPWYGRAWSTVSSALNAQTQSGAKYGTSNTVIFDTALDYAKQYGRRWDSREQGPYVAYERQNCTTTYGCVTSWRQIYYDDAVSLKLRYDFINRRGLRGAGIWALGYDADRIEMRQALAEKFLNDRTAPLAGIRALAPTQTTEAFVVSWVGSDESGIRDYDIQVSIQGGPWHDWLVKTTAVSGVYTGAEGYAFAFRVRARDTHGNVGAWDPVTTTAGAPNSTVVDLPAGVSPAAGARYVGIAPARLVDTRFGTGLSGSLKSGVARTFPVANRAGIPSNAVAVTGTATVVGQTSAGYLSVGPSAATVGRSSVVNAPRGDVRAAGITAKLGSDGTLTAMWTGAGGSSTAFLFDATGYFVPGTSGSTFVAINPARLLDSRTGVGLSGAFTSSAVRTLQVAGRGGVPAGAVAVTGNLVAIGPTSAGYLSVGPAISSAPTFSTLNVPAADTRASSTTVRLDSGRVGIVWKGTPGARANVIFDVTGYFLAGTGGATYHPLDAARVLDTRIPNGLAGVFPRNSVRTFQGTGRGTVPVDAVAVTGGATVVVPSASGWLILGPGGVPLGATSTINIPKGDIRANGVALKVGSGGSLAGVYQGAVGAAAHVIFDITGYYR